MSDNSIFNTALHNFTMDVAANDSIRHLTDKGMTPSAIRDTMTFPAPIEHIGKIMWERLVEKEIILLSVPSENNSQEVVKKEYVEEYDSLGRKHFRLVKTMSENAGYIWNEEVYENDTTGGAHAFLMKGMEKGAYIKCSFGKLKYKLESEYDSFLNSLEVSDRDYVANLPWPLTDTYHCLNERMVRIFEHSQFRLFLISAIKS